MDTQPTVSGTASEDAEEQRLLRRMMNVRLELEWLAAKDKDSWDVKGKIDSSEYSSCVGCSFILWVMYSFQEILVLFHIEFSDDTMITNWFWWKLFLSVSITIAYLYISSRLLPFRLQARERYRSWLGLRLQQGQLIDNIIAGWDHITNLHPQTLRSEKSKNLEEELDSDRNWVLEIVKYLHRYLGLPDDLKQRKWRLRLKIACGIIAGISIAIAMFLAVLPLSIVDSSSMTVLPIVFISLALLSFYVPLIILSIDDYLHSPWSDSLKAQILLEQLLPFLPDHPIADPNEVPIPVPRVWPDKDWKWPGF